MLDRAVPPQRAGLPLARADESVGAFGHAGSASGALTRTASLRRSRASQRRLLSPAVCSSRSVASCVALAAGGAKSSPAPQRRRLRELRRLGHAAIACSTRHEDRRSPVYLSHSNSWQPMTNAAGAISFFRREGTRYKNKTRRHERSALLILSSLVVWHDWQAGVTLEACEVCEVRPKVSRRSGGGRPLSAGEE